MSLKEYIPAMKILNTGTYLNPALFHAYEFKIPDTCIVTLLVNNLSLIFQFQRKHIFLHFEF